MKTILVLVFLLAGAFAFAENTHENCPMHKQAADSHHEGVNSRGDHAMGFDHEKTTHHFLLREDGGVIQVTANDATDSISTESIRAHLSHIAMLFTSGNFEIPMFIHDRVPPGVPVMKEKKAQITYKYQDVENGGSVVLSTKD